MTTRSIPKRIEAWFTLSSNVVLDLNKAVDSRSSILKPDHGVVIGARYTGSAGRSPDYGTAFHEMGHFVDIDDRRVRMPGWGLRYGKWRSSYYGGFYEMQTDAAIRREVRVMAIQAAITEHCGFNFDYLWWAKSLASGIFPNYHIWRTKLGLDYEHENDGDADKGIPSTTTAVDAGIIRSMREEFSIEAIWAEWVRKTKVVDHQIQRIASETGEISEQR